LQKIVRVIAVKIFLKMRTRQYKNSCIANSSISFTQQFVSISPHVLQSTIKFSVCPVTRQLDFRSLSSVLEDIIDLTNLSVNNILAHLTVYTNYTRSCTHTNNSDVRWCTRIHEKSHSNRIALIRTASCFKLFPR